MTAQLVYPWLAPRTLSPYKWILSASIMRVQMGFTHKHVLLTFSSLWEGLYFSNDSWISSSSSFFFTFALEKGMNQGFRIHGGLKLGMQWRTGSAWAALTRTEQHPRGDHQGRCPEPGRHPLGTASGSGSGACRCRCSRQLRTTNQFCSLRDRKGSCDSDWLWVLLPREIYRKTGLNDII